MAQRAAARVASPVFVGRTTELAALEEALAHPERTSAVLVGGEAGAGKTRLVTEFTAAAAAGGARVLAGACVALGAENLPYAPFMGALGQLAAELGPDGIDAMVGLGRADLARLVPELRRPGDDSRPGGPSDRAVLFQVVLRALEAVGAQAPLVVVLEDLHWADTSSQELLAFLLGRLRGPVLVVGTYRIDEIDRAHPLRPLLAHAARSERVVRMELAPLTPAEVARQVEAIAGAAPPPAVVEAVVARAEGNPFFVEELLAAGGGSELPPDLAEVLTARLAALPPAAQALVRVAAVAGRRVGHDLLSAALAGSGADIGLGLREATSHNVLVADAAGAYAFRHALLAEAAYAELLPAEKTALHAAYAAALAAHPEWATTAAGAAGELAHHYAAAHDPARALAASVIAAAAAADAYAFVEALALYDQALDLWDRVPDAATLAGADRAALLERAADAALLAAATDRAVALVRAALEEIDADAQPARAALAYERLARLLWRSDVEASLAANRAAVALMPAEASAERARVIAGEARTLMLAGRYHESCPRAREAIDVARAAGARREEGYALNTLGSGLGRLGKSEEAVALLEQALAIAEAVGNVEEVWRAYANLAVILEGCGQLERAAGVRGRGAARLQSLGYEDGAAHLRAGAAMALMVSGSWDEAERLAAEVLAGSPGELTTWRACMAAGTVALRRGDSVTAHVHLRRAESLTSKSADADYRGSVGAVLAELALAEGLATDARTIVDESLDALAGTDAEDAVRLLVAFGLRAEADVACDRAGRIRDEHALHARARAEALIERAGVTPPTPTVLTHALSVLCQAELARARCQPSPPAWAEAARAWAELSQPYQATYARWRLAQAHLAAGNKDEAVVALRQAFSEASLLGAAPLVAEIEALARRARVRLAVAAAPRQSGALTTRELEVLALIADGYSNRQIGESLFMSEKTASVHASRILTKLGVATRGQAAALAQREHLLDERVMP